MAGHKRRTLLVEDGVDCHTRDPETPGSENPVADFCWPQLVCVCLVDQLALLLARQGCMLLAKDAHDV